MGDTRIAIEDIHKDLMIKANIKAPYKELWSSKIAWVGDDLKADQFIDIMKGIFDF